MTTTDTIIPESVLRPTQPLGLGTDVAIFANCAAGRGQPVPELLDRAMDAVQAAGGRVINAPCEKSIGDQLRHESAEAPRLVIAIGGDGTVNAAAGVAIRHDAPLLVLPHGTMNLIARDFHLPIDPQAILEHADELAILQVDYATVNGRHFLHSALIGVVPQMTIVRERIRAADGFLGTARHIPLFVRSAFTSNPLELRLEAGCRASTRRSRSVVVTSNPLSDNGVISYTRRTVAGGRLGIYTSAHDGPFAPLKLLLSLGTGRLPRDPETLAASCETLHIHAPTPEIAVATDGEVLHLKTPLHFEIRPRALRIARPMAIIGAPAS